MPSGEKWRKRVKRNDKEHKKASLFHIAEYSNGFCFVLFLRKRLLHFQCYLFMWEKVQVKLSEAAVRRCTSKQVFLKISQCSQKTLVAESLFNKAEGLKASIFIKKVFSCEYCETFKNSLLVERFLFILLCDDIILWTSLGIKPTCFIFLVLFLFSFITLVLESRPQLFHTSFYIKFFDNSSVKIKTPYLFHTCFYIKIFSNFRRHSKVSSSTILIESLKPETTAELQQLLPVIYCQKCEFDFF